MTERIDRIDRIEHRARFDLIRYANVWEDAGVLVAALRPAPGKRFLSIASAGDNAFALLAAGAEVVAADLSPAQLALVELKRAAIRRLSHAETLAFLGVRPSADRLRIYEELEQDLPETARAIWRGRLDSVAGGVIHHGKFESYFRLFRERVLPLIHSRKTVLALLEERDAAGRERFYAERWDNLRWRLLFRVFFSRFAMGRLGRDPEFFRFVEGSVAERILGRARYALTALPTHANPYLESILTGNYGRSLPLYLEPERFAALRENLDRLTLFEGPVEAAAETHRGTGFDGFNLSDVFEYLDPATSETIYGRLLATARPGARFAYWNMLVPRRRPEALADRVRSLDAEAAELFARDLAFFYSAFILEEVDLDEVEEVAG
jgi:S-adenosylmethionine-diacylglycerol 3-amino-3-carboxypropyl transferase